MISKAVCPPVWQNSLSGNNCIGVIELFPWVICLTWYFKLCEADTNYLGNFDSFLQFQKNPKQILKIIKIE